MEESQNKVRKKTLYIDMDNVLVDFPSGINGLDEEARKKYNENYGFLYYYSLLSLMQ